MAKLSDIVSYADELLGVKKIKDYCPKGLQIEGKQDVHKIVTGVSACMSLFEAAAENGADAVMVHHGMFWDSDPKVVRGGLKARLKFLLERDMSLIAYHLPLDMHPEIGNNIGLVRALDLVNPKPFGDYHGLSIGFIAETKSPLSIAAFMQTVKQRINPSARFHTFGADEVRRVAICSGGAPELVREAIGEKADVFVTGEDTEWVYHLSKEEGIHYVAAGHHATEKLGIISLGGLIAEKFGVEVKFVDIPNPV